MMELGGGGGYDVSGVMMEGYDGSGEYDGREYDGRGV